MPDSSRVRLANGSFIKNITFEMWGKHLIVDFLYGETNIQVKFFECKQINFQVFPWSIDECEDLADVIGIQFGEDNYEKPIYITTNLYELVITYSKMEIDDSSLT